MAESRRPTGAIVDVVLTLLESEGYDAVQLRTVARRAHVSLSTIYKLFGTRDELIITAVERWLASNTCAPVPGPPPGESLYDGLMRVFRHVFEPWERNPRMLEAYHRARATPGGERLERQTMAIIGPAGRAVLADGEPGYVEDVALVLTNVAYAVGARFAAGELDITDILPTLERAAYRLTANNEPAARAAGARSTAPGQES
ncbi:TetR family transcriptional regulator [Frankia sp. CNm7]|uniref:TetR family transcriptional regulator n=1 Tax=Frankia nepalensis TaxID=1836974 RepID=A0A937RI03_9ACTN|nr:TetR family transcriptional regulator [Frankia nepalensis]MBL7498033.1 TetR family transcriptional regulator [Frankia nepalensis]MBL7513578.1 TetR family transcriptional regulator [Frankia nepalensis]MBL7518549.1 TetR family transcriptional regulator [Frankia nepalensis]MBL7629335.1 TetR family transcriptional regulator [Frankia nepalensis]